jgi:hypothetical protein
LWYLSESVKNLTQWSSDWARASASVRWPPDSTHGHVLVGEAAQVVREVRLEAARHERAGRVAAGPAGVSASPCSSAPPRAPHHGRPLAHPHHVVRAALAIHARVSRHVEHLALDGQIDRLVRVGAVMARELEQRELALRRRERVERVRADRLDVRLDDGASENVWCLLGSARGGRKIASTSRRGGSSLTRRRGGLLRGLLAVVVSWRGRAAGNYPRRRSCGLPCRVCCYAAPTHSPVSDMLMECTFVTWNRRNAVG